MMAATERVVNEVVRLDLHFNGSKSLGTGFLVNCDGHLIVLTAGHCLKNSEQSVNKVFCSFEPANGQLYPSNKKCDFLYVPHHYRPTGNNDFEQDYGFIYLGKEENNSQNKSFHLVALDERQIINCTDKLLTGYPFRSAGEIEQSTLQLSDITCDTQRRFLTYKAPTVGGMSGSPLYFNSPAGLMAFGIHVNAECGAVWLTDELISSLKLAVLRHAADSNPMWQQIHSQPMSQSMPQSSPQAQPLTQQSTQLLDQKPVQQSTQPLDQQPVQQSTQLLDQQPTQKPTQPFDQRPTQPLTQQSTQQPTQPLTQQSTQQSTQQPTQPLTQTSTQPSTQSPADIEGMSCRKVKLKTSPGREEMVSVCLPSMAVQSCTEGTKLNIPTGVPAPGDSASPERTWSSCSLDVLGSYSQPLTLSPHDAVSLLYWETKFSMKITPSFADTKHSPLFEVGLVKKSKYPMPAHCISKLPSSVAISVWKCDFHLRSVCITVWKDGKMVGMCRNTSPLASMTFGWTFGLLVDKKQGRIGLIDVEREIVLDTFVLNFKDNVFPMFYVNQDRKEYELTGSLVSGPVVSVNDAKKSLVEKALSEMSSL